jgi:hypothetical protein
MHKRIGFSLLFAATLMVLLTVAVMAQNTVIDEGEEPSASFVQIEPLTTTLRQRVPISVTIRFPLGTTDTQTVTIPMLLDLNLQISLGELVSPSVVVVAEVSPVTPVSTPRATATPTRPPSTATRAPATATPVPPSPTPTAALTTTTTTTTTETVTTTVIVTTPLTDTTTVLVPECADPRSAIVFPGDGQTVAGTVEVTGSATHENFQYYKLEYASGANASPAAEYFYLGGGNRPVESDVLATFDSQSLANGAYTLRLTVVDNTGNFPTPCQVNVQVQN